jgi:hypothetical protein
MLGSGQTGTVRAPAAASSARSQDIYQRYAAGLYRQALLNLEGSAMAEYDVCDVIVNESALARVPERDEDDARYRLAQLVFRRCQQLVAGPARQARPGQRPSGGAEAPLLRAVLGGLTTALRRRPGSASPLTKAAGRQR